MTTTIAVLLAAVAGLAVGFYAADRTAKRVGHLQATQGWAYAFHEAKRNKALAGGGGAHDRHLRFIARQVRYHAERTAPEAVPESARTALAWLAAHVDAQP